MSLASRTLGLLALAVLAWPAMAEPSSTPMAPTTPLVVLDVEGEFRGRAESIEGLRLAVDRDGNYPRLDLTHGSDPALLSTSLGDRLQSADLRLRLRPVLRVGEWSEVRGQFDLATAAVLGGNPSAGLTERFTGDFGQGLLGHVAVRRLWLHARLFGLAELDVGRMGDHFGLGLWRNAGGGLDGDWQSDVDRVALRAELFGLRLMAARDSLVSSPASGWGTTRTGWTANPVLPLQDSNDLSRLLVQVSGGRKAHQDNGLAWAVALSYAGQDTAMRAEQLETAGTTGLEATGPCPPASPGSDFDPANCIQIFDRKARWIVPQVHLDWRGNWRGRPFGVEFEGVFQYATFDNVSGASKLAGDTGVSVPVHAAMTVAAGGWAARGFLTDGVWRHQLDLGFASGQSGGGGFGVNDTSLLVLPSSSASAPAYRTMWTGFHFHRDYRIDGLLFRDVIGAVANTWYVKPAWRRQLLDGPHALGLSVGVLGALAAAPSSTPGNALLLGLEPELVADWRGPTIGATGGFDGQLRGALVVPGQALDREGVSAQWAGRVDLILRLRF
jgi:uncharacterized protein (TIGR04551 family)